MKILKSTKLLINILSFGFTALFFSSNAFACNCSGPSGKNAMRAGGAAFRGTVTNIEYLETDSGKSDPKTVVTFSVYRVWQGDVKKTFRLHTVQNGASCAGYFFVEGREYLVVAYPNDAEVEKAYGGAKNTFGTNICGATLPIESAEKALIGLGKGSKPKT